MHLRQRLPRRRFATHDLVLLLPGLFIAAVSVATSHDPIANTAPGPPATTIVAKGDAPATIGGKVTATGVGFVVANIEVRNAAGALVATTTSAAADGTYAVSGLAAPASYRVRALAPDSYFVDEVWNDIPCPLGCGSTTGVLIATTAGETVGAINFVLADGGRFSGAVTEATTGLPVGAGAVLVYDAAGDFMGDVPLTDGLYLTEAIPAGASYFAVADTSFSPELYREIPCPGLLCVPTTGTAIPVVASTTTGGIDFTVELSSLGGIAGTLRDASTGGPLAEPSFVDVFDAFGVYIDSAEVTGAFAIGDLLPGTYFLSTDTSENALTYIDELYDDLACHPAGAFNFSCDPLSGAPVSVTGGALTGGIVIELVREQLFADGFETGDLSAWGP